VLFDKKRDDTPVRDNWELVRNQDRIEDVRYLDIYNEQQIEREAAERPKTMGSRFFILALVTVAVFFVTWLVFSVFEYSSDNYGASDETVAITDPYAANNGRLDSWYTVKEVKGADGQVRRKYAVVNESGAAVGEWVDAPEELEKPSWYGERLSAVRIADVPVANTPLFYVRPTLVKVFGSLFISLVCFVITYIFLRLNLRAQNALVDTTDINQYRSDRHIQLPGEVHAKYDWFPDVGAHSPVRANSMVSHSALSNKGVHAVMVPRRLTADERDASGYVVRYAGEIEEDANGEPVMEKKPMFDREFMEALFDASDLPRDERLRVYYDPTEIPYNPGGKKFGKLGGDTLADHINQYWEMPEYEPQRPGGAYSVITDPVNTMILAITRAGKGQTVIEPTIDMWTRELPEPQNIVVNDPKGELLVKFYERATVRGMRVVQFNLINVIKTDPCNPLILASEAARAGDFVKSAQYVENIATVFFPVQGSQDPVWPNAANNAFKRVAYGLMEYYLELEREMRDKAQETRIDPKVLDNKIDREWGHVTLYNCYQFFVDLAARKLKSPNLALQEDMQNHPEKYAENVLSNAENNRMVEEAAYKTDLLWDGQRELDMLTLYFNAVAKLPRNQMRAQIDAADKSLRSMGGADKMIASVYGIAITAMSFFADPTISRLTSSTPSQNVDFASLTFPRRFGVRFHLDYMARYNFVAMQARWSAYADDGFTQRLGKEFEHEDLVTHEGWARCYFKGKFENETSYVKLEVVNPTTGLLIKTFYFRFTKTYQTSFDGRMYVKDPILDEKIVRNGVLEELLRYRTRDNRVVYRPGSTTMKSKRVDIKRYLEKEKQYERDKVDKADRDYSDCVSDCDVRVITKTEAAYTEKPKIVFFVTPPHLLVYAKLILIIMKQLIDVSIGQSYMTKPNQKPLYMVRYMIDELANLQSEGHGIEGLPTYLSIGLGQDQQFTLVLQTMQQLRDVYGENVDKVIQGNAQPLMSRIATPTGWIRMGDVRVGDEVLTRRGTSTKVTGVYPKGVRKVYRVRTRGGATCLACNEHLWKVRIRARS
jgi:type IV secretory pathway TraG/TraD family ATPase VirD4